MIMNGNTRSLLNETKCMVMEIIGELIKVDKMHLKRQTSKLGERASAGI